MHKLFDKTNCTLGEGPLWHPGLKGLVWFDIIEKKLFFKQQANAVAQVWSFDQHVSAAAIIDERSILIAAETELFKFDLISSAKKTLIYLEADNPHTRSNDGRADKNGGFWIGTMGKEAQLGLGSIYRYYAGKLTKLFSNISISNAICFSPDGSIAYFADTAKHILYKVNLDAAGFPISERQVFLDFKDSLKNPDGAVSDAAGNLHIAMWGSFTVETYNPQGTLINKTLLPAQNVSCPAFGAVADKGVDTLFVTSASQGLNPTHKDFQQAGQTFMLEYPNFKGVLDLAIKLD